jgi:hypothetical protein
VRKLDGTYELMTYDMYDQKEKLGEVKNKKYLVDVVRRQKRLKYEITAAKHVCSVAFPANFQGLNLQFLLLIFEFFYLFSCFFPRKRSWRRKKRKTRPLRARRPRPKSQCPSESRRNADLPESTGTFAQPTQRQPPPCHLAGVWMA